MPIDLSTVNWIYVGVLAVFAFFSSLVGNLLALNHRGTGAVLAAVIFAALFVFWTYYPHGLPLPTRLTDKSAATVTTTTTIPSTPAAPAPAQRPTNPVTSMPPASSDVPPPKPQ